MKKRLLTSVIVVLTVLELMLVLLSWILSSMMAEGVRSLLSSEGIRWFFGQYVQLLQSPFLISLLLLSFASGVFVKSGILHKPTVYRDRIEQRVAAGMLVIYLVVLSSLTLFPHAILLSATGTLFPSPFSKALGPLVAFGMILVATVYGVIARTYTSVSAVIDASVWGLAKAAPLLLVYVFFVQFYVSLRFVF